MAIGCNWHPWSNNNTKIPFKHFPIPYYFQTPFHHLHPIFHLGLTPYGPQHFFPLCSKVGIPQKISIKLFQLQVMWLLVNLPLIARHLMMRIFHVRDSAPWVMTWHHIAVGAAFGWKSRPLTCWIHASLGGRMSVIVGEAFLFFWGGELKGCVLLRCEAEDAWGWWLERCKSLPKIQRFTVASAIVLSLKSIPDFVWIWVYYYYYYPIFLGEPSSQEQWEMTFCYFLGIFLVVNLASWRWDPKLHHFKVYSFFGFQIYLLAYNTSQHISVYTHICDICQCSIHDLLQSRHPYLRNPSSSGSHHFRECANFQLHGINKTKSLPNALSARCLVIWCRCSTISFYRQRISSS